MKIHRNGTEYDDEGFDNWGYNKEGYNREGFNRNGYDKEGYDKDGLDKDGYDRKGYDQYGYDKEGYNREGFNRYRIHRNETEYDDEGFNYWGHDKEGYNRNGFNEKGIYRNGTKYDNEGFDYWGYNKETGYNRKGYDKYGYNKNFEIDDESPLSETDRNILNALGYKNNGLDDRGFRFDEIHHITRTRYDEQGYDINGWNQEGINIETQSEYDSKGFNIKGIHQNGTPYDNDGYDKNGFSSQGIDRRHFRRDGTNTYTNKKFDLKGYDINGYDSNGYDINGVNRLGYDMGDIRSVWQEKEDYMRYLNSNWYLVGKVEINFNTRTLWGEDGYTAGIYTYASKCFDQESVGVDREGYDRDGYNSKGTNRNGLTREEQEEKEAKEKEIKKNQRRSNYFGLKNKAEKLGKGEMTLEDYVKCSKTSIDDLIIFAKKENMEADVIRGLYKYVKPYKSYKTPFAKTDYLKSTILIINGQEVKPTEEDVDKCVEYLKASGSLICDKTVRNTVRGYLKGEIDITIKEEDLEEQTAENKEIISENEQKISDELVRVLVEQQDKVKSQKVEIANLKKKGIGTYGE